ncbi:alcohol acetyltransferase-domain-containing protein [Hypoxylon fuscum]|nr:alcohol acetyltransferase-domain-containing protein [Hypoxylon fuscum]
MEPQPWRRDPSAANASVIRGLGTNESYQIALQNLDQMRGNILTCRYKVPMRLVPHGMRHDLIETFERAVARVVLKHPLMHVGLVGEDTDMPCWVRLGSLNLRQHIEWRILRGDSSHFQKVFLATCYEQLDTKFTNFLNVPGWKIKVLRQEGADFIEVLLILNHTNMDGNSAKTVHRDLLQSLHDDPHTPKDDLLRDHIITLPESSTARLSPPAENLVGFPVETGLMIKFLQEEVRTPAARYPKRKTGAHWAPIKAAPFKTQFRTITIPNNVLSELVKSCRHHKTTLTGLLHALTLVSLAPLLEPSNAAGFECLTAMDLRRFLPSHHPSYPWLVPSRAMSNYVTIVDHILDENLVARIRSKTSPYSPDGFQSGVLMDTMWSAARKVRRDIEAKLDQGLNNDMVGFWRIIGDWRAQLSEEARRPRRTSWVITNLGLIDDSPSSTSSSPYAAQSAKPDSDSNWSITRTQFIMCANVVSSAIGISTATLKGGDLIVTCTWQDCVIDVNLGEAFVANLERWLKFTARYRDGWPASGHGSAFRPP